MTINIRRPSGEKNPEPMSSLTEEEMTNELGTDYRTDQLRAEVDAIKAKTDDVRLLTDMKREYARGVMCFMWLWGLFIIVFVLGYFSHMFYLHREIPKEVIISMFTCTAVVVGLVGYIIKGLFGSK